MSDIGNLYLLNFFPSLPGDFINFNDVFKELAFVFIDFPYSFSVFYYFDFHSDLY